LVSQKLWATSPLIINYFSENLLIMNDMIDDEQTPIDGEVPTSGVPSREDGEILESEDEVDADAIRNARTIITISFDNRDPPRVAPARLAFSFPDARDNLDPEEDPKPRAIRPLN
jgi:hypothetical protein